MLESIVNGTSMMGPMLVTLLIGVCTSVLLYWFSIRNHDYWKKQGIPFIKPYPFVGSVVSNLRKPLHETELLRYKEYGAVYGHFEGNRALISVADPKLLRDIFVKDFQNFTGRRVPLDYFIGQGFLQPKEVDVQLELRENPQLVK